MPLRQRLGLYVLDLLTRCGALLGPRACYAVEVVANYLWIGSRFRRRGWAAVERVRGPAILGERLTEAFGLGDRRTLYLEFGSFEGASMRRWSRLLAHPEASLHGFDTFEGLPGDYTPLMPRGSLHAGGSPPRIEDARVVWHVGLFDETLPKLEAREYDTLVAYLDADLYSSTIFVLRQLQERFRTGDLVIFGQLHQKYHELRALEEFLDESGLPFEPVLATLGLRHVAFRLREA